MKHFHCSDEKKKNQNPYMNIQVVEVLGIWVSVKCSYTCIYIRKVKW